MSRSLPPRPNLEHLKKEAKTLLKAYRSRNAAACEPLRHLRRFRDLPDENFFALRLSLQEVQFALALDYGFANWSELKDHVLRLRVEAASKGYTPSREDVLGFYLREDVSQALWELSRRRALKFFYRCDGDIRDRETRVHHTTLHYLRGPEEFRERVVRVVRDSPCPPHPFYPFFGMTQKPVTKPGRKDEPIGWDYRLEFDFELADSFRALLPVVALLRHFGVPALSKYSGHRSLHVIVPAEAFPEKMRKQPNQRQWMAVVDLFARFLCRFGPMLNRCGAGLAKSFDLSAPYSFHRYNGLISLPLPYEDLWDFDPERARCDRFEGVTWRPEDFDGEGQAMNRLLEAAERAEAEPGFAIGLAGEVFADDEWDEFVAASAPETIASDPVTAALLTGLPAAGWLGKQPALEPSQGERTRSVMACMDSPETKSARIGRLARPAGFAHPNFAAARESLAENLAVWVNEGFAAFLTHLRENVLTAKIGQPVAFAVRVLSIVPESQETVFAALRDAWTWPPEPEPATLFHALALAELNAFRKPALDLFPRNQEWANELKKHLLNAGDWRVEKRPDLVLAVLALMFGLEQVRKWTEEWRSEDARRVYEPLLGSLLAEDGSPHPHDVPRLKHATSQLVRMATGEEKP